MSGKCTGCSLWQWHVLKNNLYICIYVYTVHTVHNTPEVTAITKHWKKLRLHINIPDLWPAGDLSMAYPDSHLTQCQLGLLPAMAGRMDQLLYQYMLHKDYSFKGVSQKWVDECNRSMWLLQPQNEKVADVFLGLMTKWPSDWHRQHYSKGYK